MKIISWNVNSLRVRLEQLSFLIKNEDPNIILLQETKIEDQQFPKEFFHTLGYDSIFWGQKSYNGVAILSKLPLEKPARKDFLESNEARYIEATTYGMRIACVYVPNGRSIEDPFYQKKLQFLKALADNFILDMMTLAVVAGDFNVALKSEDVFDQHFCDGQLLCSKEERSAMAYFIHKGFEDCIFTQYGQKNPFTWWHYQGRAFELDKGMRLDYCFLSARALDRLDQAGVISSFREKIPPSDHAPIWVDLWDEDRW